MTCPVCETIENDLSQLRDSDEASDRRRLEAGYALVNVKRTCLKSPDNETTVYGHALAIISNRSSPVLENDIEKIAAQIHSDAVAQGWKILKSSPIVPLR